MLFGIGERTRHTDRDEQDKILCLHYFAGMENTMNERPMFMIDMDVLIKMFEGESDSSELAEQIEELKKLSEGVTEIHCCTSLPGFLYALKNADPKKVKHENIQKVMNLAKMLFMMPGGIAEIEYDNEEHVRSNMIGIANKLSGK